MESLKKIAHKSPHKENPKVAVYSVEEVVGDGFTFPTSIPCQRSNRRKLFILLGAIINLLIASCFASYPVLFFFTSLSLIYIMLFCVELFCRICAVFEEVRHFKARYESSITTLLKDVFGFSTLSVCFCFLSLFICILFFALNKGNVAECFEGAPVWVVPLLATSMGLLSKVTKLEDCELNQSLKFDELRGCDCGAGMAHSFFYGYLRIMLPHTGRGGEEDAGIKELQQKYEARNQIKFECYKLFILIPLSQTCFPSLEKFDSVESRKELDEKEIDRAGVKRRNYKNSVYKIKRSQNDAVYVCAEYATPVKTFGEVMKHSSPCSQMYKKHRKEILLNFYLTLRQLIKEDEDCRDLCELIYYNDKDKMGEFRDVGKVILKRLLQLKKNL